MPPPPSPARSRSWSYAPGEYLGRYQILRRIAAGGMAELYLGCAAGIQGFRKLVALKRVLPQLAEDGDFTRMFLHEARLAAGLDHPNIAQVIDIGDERGEYFFVMEYIHGENASALLRASDGPLPLASALAIVLGVAAGLHYAHERVGPDGRPLGIVHRDVSPHNVLVSFEGSVKLVDFGIAKVAAHTSATRTGTLKGKVGYMSPEQCRGEPLDRRSDVFALGILLHELTTGRRMFFGDNDYAVMNRITSGEHTRPSALIPDYPAALEQICLRAVHLDREQRHPTAEALQSDLEDFIRSEQRIVSSRLLAQTMRTLFGARPYPTPELLPTPPSPPPEPTPLATAERDESSMQTRRTDVTRAPGRAPRRLLLLAGVSGAALLAAAIFMRLPDAAAPATSALTTQAPEDARVPATQTHVAAPLVAADAPAGRTTTPSAGPPVATDGASSPVPSVRPDPTDAGRAPTRRNVKSRPASPRRTPAPTPTRSARDLDAMFPGGR